MESPLMRLKNVMFKAFKISCYRRSLKEIQKYFYAVVKESINNEIFREYHGIFAL